MTSNRRATVLGLTLAVGLLVVRLVASEGHAASAVVAPPDQPVSMTVGPVVINTFNPVTITPFETGTILYFVAQNTGATAVTLQLASWNQLITTKPSWMYHLFKFFGFREKPNEPPADSVVLQPGETRSLELHASKDINGGPAQQADLAFRFVVVETGASGTLTITVRADDSQDVLRATSATISGRIAAADGTPIVGAEVIATLLNQRGTVRAFTRLDGTYRLDVVSIDHVRTLMGPRTYPYRSIDYFVTATLDGYRLGYQPGIAPATGQTVTVDMTLQPLTARPVYRLVGELPTDGLIAYWWTRFAGNNDRVVAVLGQHPPVEPMPGHIIAVSLTGQELWRVVTGKECWGLDVSADGSVVAAGCYDGYLYLVASSDGRLLHKVKLGAGAGWVQTVKFSPDGKYVVADGAGPPSFTEGISVVTVATGAIAWSSTVTGANKAVWTADGDVVAARTGPLAKFSPQGVLKWRTQLGESPLWMETDSASNIYTSGKTLMLTSTDKDGKERWRFRAAATSNEGVRTISTDGSFMLLPSFNGQLQALNSSGTLLWQRFMPGLFPSVPPCDFGPGHNALSMLPDARLIVIGTKCFGVEVYDRNGSVLWSHKASLRADFKGQSPLVYGNYTGTQSVDITADGRYIAAGYADAVVRIFKRAPTMVANRTALRFSATKAGANGALTSVTPPQSIAMSASDAPLEAWTASSNQPWLSLTSASASASGAFSVAIVNPENVLGGSIALTATITVTSPTAANSPVTIPVTLTIDQTNGASGAGPIGGFDSPTNGSPNIVGAIAVTGWALDDIGVERVEIWRNCLTPVDANRAGVCRNATPTGLPDKVFIGTAAFVPGARSDIETNPVYASYPQTYRAGWGYLLLTNALPNQVTNATEGGQGAVTLYAYAIDREGRYSELGSKLITLNNDNAIVPFGAIDTPEQGGTVTAAVSANFGWAMTRRRNAAGVDIPKCIERTRYRVFIDGVARTLTTGVNWHPNLVRADLTAAYPGLCDSANSLAAYYIDVTALGLANGLHTIGWDVYDDNGTTGTQADDNVAGIGSRFFNILVGAVDVPNGGRGFSRAESGDRLSGRPVKRGETADITALPVTEARALRARVGAIEAPVVAVAGDASGRHAVILPQGSRLTVDLGGAVERGYLVVGDELRDLPIGSTLDAARGHFYWQPAVPFFGSFELVFVTDAQVTATRTTVVVTVTDPTASGDPAITISSPKAGANPNPVISVTGTARDPQAITGAGVETVHVWAYRRDVEGVPPQFLGEAFLKGEAYALTTAPLTPGTYDLAVFAWVARTGTWAPAATVTIAVR